MIKYFLLFSFFSFIYCYNLSVSKELIGDFNTQQCDIIVDDEKIDCFPENSINEKLCVTRNCCWQEKTTLNVPKCFFPKGYQAYQVINHETTQIKQKIELLRKTPIPYHDLYDKISIEIYYLNDVSLRIQFQTSQKKLFVPPIDLDLPEHSLNERQYAVEIKNNKANVIRLSTNKVIWSADLNTLVLSGQFNQIKTTIASNILYGLGEHDEDFVKVVKNDKKYLFFNRNQTPGPNKNLYGTHPMYLNYENPYSEKNNAHSVLLFNTHAIELLMLNEPALIWRTLGGTFDFFINLGPTPMEAIKQHVNIVGKPPLIPFWALGFHLSRYGYDTLENTKKVNQRTLKAQIPLDVQWNDIEYMDNQNMFTVDQKKFFGLKSFIDELHTNNMKYMCNFSPYLDISNYEKENKLLSEYSEKNLFINTYNDEILKTKILDKNFVSLIDFTSPDAVNFWIKNLKIFNQKVPFDGTWIDKNEPSTENDCNKNDCPWNDKLEKPDYVPLDLNLLAKKSICMTSKHYLGSHYDYHNLYGYYQAKATRQALVEMNKRPFIISKATVTGFGRYGSHWTGNIVSSWQGLQDSIQKILNFNFFGIPFVGSDICGYKKDTTEELCARWFALGAFYPFARSHNDKNAIDQDPVALGDKVVSSAKYALQKRYSLLSLFYTELYKSSLDGRPAVRGLSFVFPEDIECYKNKNQFLWGDSLMVMPVINEGVEFLNVYFPEGNWFDFETLELMSNSNNGSFVKKLLPLDRIGLAIRGGNVLFIQNPRQTSTETKKENYKLIIALDKNNSAKGDIYLDDGISNDLSKTNNYSYIEILVKNNQIENNILSNKFKNVNYISSIEILGENLIIKSLVLNSKVIEFKSYKNKVSVNNLNLSLIDLFNIKWT